VILSSPKDCSQLDLLVTLKGKRCGFEFKYGDAPALTKSMHIARQDLRLKHRFVVYPGKESYTLDRQVNVISSTPMSICLAAMATSPWSVLPLSPSPSRRLASSWGAAASPARTSAASGKPKRCSTSAVPTTSPPTSKSFRSRKSIPTRHSSLLKVICRSPSPIPSLKKGNSSSGFVAEAAERVNTALSRLRLCRLVRIGLAPPLPCESNWRVGARNFA